MRCTEENLDCRHQRRNPPRTRDEHCRPTARAFTTVSPTIRPNRELALLKTQYLWRLRPRSALWLASLRLVALTRACGLMKDGAGEQDHETARTSLRTSQALLEHQHQRYVHVGPERASCATKENVATSLVKKAGCLFVLAFGLGSTTGCSVGDEVSGGFAESEVRAADRLVGTWVATAAERPVLSDPELRELTLTASTVAPGAFRFSAEVDTGLRPLCLPGGPCPSGLQHLEGSFTASALRLNLKSASAQDAVSERILVSYVYKFASDEALALTLNGKTASFAKRSTPAFCAGGRVEIEQVFESNRDGKTTLREVKHCMTTANNTCLKPVRPPPDYCRPGSHLVMGAIQYSASSDGKECALAEGVHCVSTDDRACPQPVAPGPDYCPNGTVYQGPSRFIDSTNGFECEIGSLACVRSGAT